MGVRRQTTCWLRADQEQTFFGIFECYVEALQRLKLLAEAPSLEREAGAHGVRVTFVLRWVDEDAPERSSAHDVVRVALRQLLGSCQRMRLVGSESPIRCGSDMQPLLT